MQKFPLRNRCKPNNNKAFRSSDTHIRMRRDCYSCSCSPHEMPPSAPQKLQRICQPIPSATSVEKRQLSMEKPVKVCNRVFTEEADENVATWNDVLSRGKRCKQSKSLPSPAVSFAQEVVVDSDIAAAEKQEPLQRITSAGGKLELPCNVTESSSSTSNNNNTDTNGNRNKDDDVDDDDNNRRSRLELELEQHQNHQSKTQAEAAVMSAAASAPEFITIERLRLADQINFILFDPYRTLKFLITELKSRLKTVVPEIQQTIKRIRIPNNASEPVLQPVATAKRKAINKKTTTIISTEEAPPLATSAAEAVSTAEAVKNILPKARCHIIKNDPLRNHVMKVNSSCQTIASQLENVNACQMCECEHYQVNHQGTVGCNQNRINENNSNADDDGRVKGEKVYSTEPYRERSKDHRKDAEVRESFSCKSLQGIIENLKIKNNPLSLDTQRIVAQLESELLNFQRELRRTSSSSASLSDMPHDRPLGGSTQENSNSNLQSKRELLLDKKREYPEQEGENKNEEEPTFQDFIADKLQLKFWKHSNRLNSSSTQTAAAAAGALSISKESQTNLKSPTQMFCHLEKEKLLVMQKFRTSEMQTIQGDLNELHVFIKDQLNGIYQSITRENLKYFSNDQSRRRASPDKNKHENRQKNFPTFQQPEKTQAKGLPMPSLASSSSLLSSSPPLTAPTSSSVLSSSQRMHEGGSPLPMDLMSILPRHYKKSSAPADNGNANNTKSMMKQQQKSSSNSLSTADAKERHNISDVDKAYKAVLGEKKSKYSHQQLYRQEHLLANCRARCGFTDTPFCSGGEKNHFLNVDCGCRRSSSQISARTQIDGRVQRMMGEKASRTSTTKSSRPGPAVMTHYQQHHQQSATTPTTGTAQDQIQSIYSSLPAPPPAAAAGAVMKAPPPYITTRRTDETSVNPDTMTNAAVKTIIKDAYATTVTAAAATAPKAAAHSNGIREPSHRARNSWQRVNLKNPTGCQMKKQICGADGYECTINNNNNDNRSNYPQIHDCQKYRANSINPFCGLCSAKMHKVGADNGATAFAAATASDDFDYDDDDYRGYGVRDGDDGGAGGDGPINWKGENKSLAYGGEENFTCHPKKRHRQRRRWRWQRQSREQTPRLLHCCVAQSAFQTDLDEFKEFLDEIILSTPRME